MKIKASVRVDFVCGGETFDHDRIDVEITEDDLNKIILNKVNDMYCGSVAVDYSLISYDTVEVNT